MLTKKKKNKLSKMLATIIHIAQNEHIHFESKTKIFNNVLDVSYEIGGFRMMNTVIKCVEELQKE